MFFFLSRLSVLPVYTVNARAAAKDTEVVVTPLRAAEVMKMMAEHVCYHCYDLVTVSCAVKTPYMWHFVSISTVSVVFR